MKKTLAQWLSVCCIALCTMGIVSISGCGGPSSTPTGVVVEENDDFEGEDAEGEGTGEDGGGEGGDE